MSAWVNLQGDRCLGNGQMLKNRAGVPGPGLPLELSCSRVSLEHQWLTAAVVWCSSLRMIVQSYTFPKKPSPPSPGSTNKVLTDWPHPTWSASPTSAGLGSPLTLWAKFSPDWLWLPLTGFLSAVSHCVWGLLVTPASPPAGLLLNTSQVTLSCNFTAPLLLLKESWGCSQPL